MAGYGQLFTTPFIVNATLVGLFFCYVLGRSRLLNSMTKRVLAQLRAHILNNPVLYELEFVSQFILFFKVCANSF